MSSHDPISIQIHYTTKNHETVEKPFRSLSQASKFITNNIVGSPKLSIQTLKELSLGLTPKLPENVPSDLTVVRIPTMPRIPKIPAPKTQPAPNIHKDEMWHCDSCNREIKFNSKYSHLKTKSHIIIKETLKKNAQTQLLGGT
jgi:hypothetical protein